MKDVKLGEISLEEAGVFKYVKCKECGCLYMSNQIHSCIIKTQETFTKSDLDFLLKEFVIPSQNTLVCDELDGYEEEGERNECWCVRNCKWHYPVDKCYYKLIEKRRKKNG